MANKQTRRSVSLERRLYETVMKLVPTLNQTGSEYVSKLIKADLKSRGIEIPPGQHVKERAPRKPRSDRKMSPSTSEVQEADIPVAITSADISPVDKSKECAWCGINFKKGEIPTEHDGHKLHGKCKREVMRLDVTL